MLSAEIYRHAEGSGAAAGRHGCCDRGSKIIMHFQWRNDGAGTGLSTFIADGWSLVNQPDFPAGYLWPPVYQLRSGAPALANVLPVGGIVILGSVFKRGFNGVYQHCGEQHFHHYLNEFTFRYSNRVKLGVHDFERARLLMKGTEGKRLTNRRISAD